jgi:drug/metabolite transporter, DME family
MRDTDKNKRVGYLMVIMAGIFWGTAGTISKYIFAFGVDPLTLAMLRNSISFVALYLFAVITGRRVRLQTKDISLFFFFGLVSVALFNYLYLTAIQLTTVTTAVVLLYTAPAFSMLAARLVLGESLTSRKAASLIMTFAGIVLLVEAFSPGRVILNVSGVLAGIGSGLTYGIYSIFSKEALKRGYGTLETVIIALGFALLFLLPLRPPWSIIPLFGEPLLLWLLVLAMALLATMLAYVLFVSGLVHVEAGRATLTAAVEPVAAILLAMLFLGETLSLIQVIGVAAVLGAIRWQAG